MLGLEKRCALQTTQGASHCLPMCRVWGKHKLLRATKRLPMPADVQGLSTTFLRALTLPLSPWCVGCLPGDAIEQGRHGARTGMVEEERRLVKVSIACHSNWQP